MPSAFATEEPTSGVEDELLAAAHPVTGLAYPHFKLALCDSAEAGELRPFLVPTTLSGAALLEKLHGRTQGIVIPSLHEYIPVQKVEKLEDGTFGFRLIYRGAPAHNRWLTAVSGLANALWWLILNPDDIDRPG